ncbi:MAG: hypothetical protein LBU32_09560 [Clostridiales bacterium]|nr:hypothetical protein [Clostridiales bacterium]
MFISIKSKIAIIFAGVGMMSAAAFANSIFWFIESPLDMTEEVAAQEKTVSVSIKQSYESGKAITFTMKNNGSIDSFVRIGWTPVYQNKSGANLALDASDVMLDKVEITTDENFSQPTAISSTIRLSSMHAKNMISVLDENGFLYIFKPGQTLSGVIEIAHAPYEGIEPKDSGSFDNLNIILTPECIEATLDAVSEASDWGWNALEIPQ